MARADARRPSMPALASIVIPLTLSVTPAHLMAQQSASKPYAELGSISREDDRLGALIPEGAKLEILTEGHEWSEGPVWSSEKGGVLFSDIPHNTVFLWTEAGGLEPFLKPSGYTGNEDFQGVEPGSNGLLIDPEGQLILCQHGDRRVAKLLPEGGFETLADAYDGKRLNSPNDLVRKSDGSIYFTDPPYGLPKNVDDPAKELPFQGVYRLDPDGAVTLLTDKMTRPNGIGFSPDESTLYVANSDPEHAVWMAFPVLEDGGIGEGKVFADVTAMMGTAKGSPDGMVIDAEGNLFATGPGGVHIYAPDGTRLGIIQTGEATANCTFGGEDGSILFVTADMYLCRLQTTTKGMRVGN